MVGVNELVIALGAADAADEAAVALREYANVISDGRHVPPLTDGDGHIIL